MLILRAEPGVVQIGDLGDAEAGEGGGDPGAFHRQMGDGQGPIAPDQPENQGGQKDDGRQQTAQAEQFMGHENSFL